MIVTSSVGSVIMCLITYMYEKKIFWSIDALCWFILCGSLRRLCIRRSFFDYSIFFERLLAFFETQKIEKLEFGDLKKKKNLLSPFLKRNLVLYWPKIYLQRKKRKNSTCNQCVFVRVFVVFKNHWNLIE